MSEQTAPARTAAAENIAAQAVSAGHEAVAEAGDPELNLDAGMQGAAAFADAETREILNLLGETEAGGSCCGGSCCS
ncbi:MAG: hypothetical protein ACK5LO_05340 [Leucobacter sp.]